MTHTLGKELRLGNHLQWRHYTMGWGDIRVDENASWIIADALKSPDSYRPIQITIDWLKKFGFITTQYVATGDFQVYGEKIFRVGDHNYMIRVQADTYEEWNIHCYRQIGSEEIKVFQTIKKIHGVHELQNSIYFLTGQEL